MNTHVPNQQTCNCGECLYVRAVRRYSLAQQTRIAEAHEQQANPRTGHDPGDEDGER